MLSFLAAGQRREMCGEPDMAQRCLDEFVAQASTNAAATMAQEMPRLAKRANEQREAAQFHKKALPASAC